MQRDADQVGVEIQIQRLHAFVLNRDLGIQVLGHQRRQRGQRQRCIAQRRFEDARAMAMNFAGRG